MRNKLSRLVFSSTVILALAGSTIEAEAQFFTFAKSKSEKPKSPAKQPKVKKKRTAARLASSSKLRKARLGRTKTRRRSTVRRRTAVRPQSRSTSRASRRRYAANQRRSSFRKTYSQTDRVNSGRVGLISGGIGGTYIRIATDLASVLNEGNKMRILPIVGQGSVQNITDILYLKGVDIGIVQSDVLTYIKARGLHRNIDRRINYITKLYNEEFHLIGGREIEDIRDLEGKHVNFGVAGSGTFMTATTVFEQLGINVKPVNHDQALAIEKIRNGEIAATVFVAGKPTGAVADLKQTYGLQLIPVPYDRSLHGAYLPARFTSEDYPELISSGDTVDSIAVGAVMAVYNWSKDNSRYPRVRRFVDSFFSRIQEFRSAPRHKKWQEVNLAAKLPGWKRFTAAEQWLDNNQLPDDTRLKVSFSAFMEQNSAKTNSTPQGAEREALFKAFLDWQKSRP